MCWLAFEVVFVYIYVVETKNVRASFVAHQFLAEHVLLARSERSKRPPREPFSPYRRDYRLTRTIRLFDGEEAVAKLEHDAAREVANAASEESSMKDKGSDHIIEEVK